MYSKMRQKIANLVLKTALIYSLLYFIFESSIKELSEVANILKWEFYTNDILFFN